VTKTDLAEYEQFFETRPIKGKHLKACVPMDLDPIHRKAHATDYTNDAKEWLGVLPDFVTELVRRSQIDSIDLTWVSEGPKLGNSRVTLVLGLRASVMCTSVLQTWWWWSCGSPGSC
jgi:hypothetical protein